MDVGEGQSAVKLFRAEMGKRNHPLCMFVFDGECEVGVARMNPLSRQHGISSSEIAMGLGSSAEVAAGLARSRQRASRRSLQPTEKGTCLKISFCPTPARLQLEGDIRLTLFNQFDSIN